MARTDVNIVRGIATDNLKCTTCEKTLCEKECFFHCDNCNKISLCQECVLQGKSSTGCDLRSAIIEAQDLRPTFIHGMTDIEFRSMTTEARDDASFKFPHTAKKFLSQCNPPEGLTRERLLSNHSYQFYETDEAATTRRIRNDYSLYDKLDREKKEIRLAWIIKGPEGHGITAVVGRFPFPWTQVTWTALSYCWGPLDETRKIRLTHVSNYLHDGNKPQARYQLFTCTASLEMALRGVRHEDENFFFWVDALCVNQADYEERSYQISIMSEIFAQANYVCVWLGYNMEQTMASGLIRAISQLAKEGRKSGQYPPETSDGQIAGHILDSCTITKGNEPLDRFEAIKIISTFFTNPWFRRVWVLQEVWNARSEVLVLCGRNAPVVWDEVLLANQFLTNAFAKLHTQVSALIEPWKSFEKGVGATAEDASFQRMNILELFETVCHGFNATDARDKLFGILSMGKETHDIANLDTLMTPDYTKPVSQVFVDFTRWYIRQYRSLDVLGYATYTLRNKKSGPLSANVAPESPSWALSHLRKFAAFGPKICEVPGYNAQGATPLNFELLDYWQKQDSHLLALQGYRLGVVEKAEGLYFSSRWDKNNELWLRNDEANDGDGMSFPGALKFLWSGIISPKTGKPPKECEPAAHTGTESPNSIGNSNCTSQELLDNFLMTVTQGGMKQHADCDHRKGIHRNRWLKPSELYPDFAAHWVKPAEKYNSMILTMTHKDSPNNPMKQTRLIADPEMTLFCPHVRDTLLPLASNGNAENFSMMLMHCNRQVLAELQNGTMGLCPMGTQKGDIVVALFGGKAPFVLRSRPSNSTERQMQEWTFIGECYFQDFMDGKHVTGLVEGSQPCETFMLR